MFMVSFVFAAPWLPPRLFLRFASYLIQTRSPVSLMFRFLSAIRGETCSTANRLPPQTRIHLQPRSSHSPITDKHQCRQTYVNHLTHVTRLTHVTLVTYLTHLTCSPHLPT